MIEDRIQKLESRVRQAGGIPEETKKELLDLIAALKTELPEGATVGATGSSFSEEDHESAGPEALQTAVDDLTESVESLEASHPVAVQVVNRIALILSNMGI